MSSGKQLPLPFIVENPFQHRNVKSVTFKGKFDCPIHRWFRLTPSFSPELVTDILAHWKLPSAARILDPFCGVGTTLLVCQSMGFESCGVELNPLLHFVSTVKVASVDAPEQLTANAKQVCVKAENVFTILKPLSTSAFQAEYGHLIPSIREVTKWWSPVVLKKLVALRIALSDQRLPGDIRDLLQLAVVSILIEVSNARHNHPSLSFAKIARDDAPVFERFVEQVALMERDLADFRQLRPPAAVLHANSKHLNRILPSDRRFDAVLTSPPYPNRYSYARETRPQMFYMGFVRDGREVGELETDAIGGTWGKATSVLNEHHDYRSGALEQALAGIAEQVGVHSRLMRNYIVKYFNDMEQHIESLQPLLRDQAHLAYVIGNSQFYDVVLASDEILANLFEAHGFKTASIERMRRRNSKSGLYEAVVFLTYSR